MGIPPATRLTTMHILTYLDTHDREIDVALIS